MLARMWPRLQRHRHIALAFMSVLGRLQLLQIGSHQDTHMDVHITGLFVERWGVHVIFLGSF
jgi:hypothetical protein